MLAQLGLLGPYAEIPERLFVNTRHTGQSSKTVPVRVKRKGFRLTQRYGTLPSPEWWDPNLTKKITFPEWRQLKEYAASIGVAPLSMAQKLRAYAYVAPWLRRHFRRMMKDLLIAADQVLYNWQNRRAANRQAKASQAA